MMIKIVGQFYIKTICLIIRFKNQEMSFGVPFLIQHNINEQYLSIELQNAKQNKIDEFFVVQKKKREPGSLLVIFDMK
ncbi:unnamed protein product [Paramecium sonneborni]|uniref:Uncharacterized protein n=1 Tax=Paramecium sonneborni TaxID=65129 RepID=A0A8S1N8L3_9CILI|nr:unnamed protein product [Paramecium sonneborni]